jgi:PAS domain S-box-containing protein
MTDAKNDYVAALDTIIDTYTYLSGDENTAYPQAIRDELKKYTGYKDVVAGLKNAIKDGGTFWLPNDFDMETAWWPSANGPGVALGINMGKLFNPGYLSLNKILELNGSKPKFVKYYYDWTKNGDIADVTEITKKEDFDAPKDGWPANAYWAVALVVNTKHLVDSDGLMQFVDGSIHMSENELVMSPAQMILSACATAAICIDNEMIIQTVNLEVKKITGFTPDQLIGRHIDWVVGRSNDHLCEYDNQRLHAYLRDVNSLQSSGFIVQVTLENGGYATMTCNVLSLQGNRAVLLLRDITEDTKQRESAEAIRVRTEQLLNSLMPAEMREAGHQTIETVTLIFIEITGITECVHTLSQQELLTALNRVYERFEALEREFPSFMLIKGYEELFVGTTGLKGPLPVQQQVDQALTFSYSVLDQVDAMNEQFELNLRLKAAVNTGGPVEYGALSETIPNFEIFGDLVAETEILLLAADDGTLRIGSTVTQYINAMTYLARDIGPPGFVLLKQPPGVR